MSYQYNRCNNCIFGKGVVTSVHPPSSHASSRKWILIKLDIEDLFYIIFCDVIPNDLQRVSDQPTALFFMVR